MAEHWHEWQPAEVGWACAECTETCPSCIVTRKGETHPTGTSLLICDVCVKAEGRVLDDIDRALGHVVWAPGSGQLAAARYDRDMVHGTGMGEESPRLSLGDVADILWSWVANWTDASGDAQNTGAIAYLKGHVMWAAHNSGPSGWEEYRKEVRVLRTVARREAGLLPQREAVPCVHCGGTVVRDWADPKWEPRSDGLSDVVRCSGCGMKWEDRTRWDHVNHLTLRALPESKMCKLVTLEDARLIWPHVPAATIRSWMLRDREAEVRQVPERGWDVRGVPVYRLGDLDALVTRHADEGRRGPKTERIGA